MEYSRLHSIPIYEFTFEVVVTTDIIEAQKNKARRKRLGEGEVGPYQGLTWYRGRNISVIFDKKYLTHGLISHELFHSSHRIMEYINHKFSEEGHEPYACLLEHLTNLVYTDLKRWHIRPK